MTSESDLSFRLLNSEIQDRLKSKDVAGLAAMVDAGLDVNHTNAENYSLLCSAVLDSAVLNSDKSEMVRMLIGRGANVEQGGHYTPLGMALSFGRSGAVAALLDGGANPNKICEVRVNAKLPLHYAMSTKELKPSLRLLLQAGASLDYFEKLSGLPALHQCIFNNNPQALTVLLEFGQDPRKVAVISRENSMEFAVRISKESALNRSEIIQTLTAWMDCQDAQDAVDEVLKNADPSWKGTQDKFSDEPKELKKRGARP